MAWHASGHSSFSASAVLPGCSALLSPDAVHALCRIVEVFGSSRVWNFRHNSSGEAF